jgi:hypothetical protein
VAEWIGSHQTRSPTMSNPDPTLAAGADMRARLGLPDDYPTDDLASRLNRLTQTAVFGAFWIREGLSQDT